MERRAGGSAGQGGQVAPVGDGERAGDGEGFRAQDEAAEGVERGCGGGEVSGAGAVEGAEGGGGVGWVVLGVGECGGWQGEDDGGLGQGTASVAELACM